ncbi:MAG: lactate utilization protein [Peptococcaceae bacterium]|nr:lactate utilization protein [Peptococcaceae bacterium]
MTDLRPFFEERARRVVAALNKNLFEGLYVPTGQQALEEILKRVPEGAAVGVGGSVTLRQIGAVEALKKRGHVVFDHWQEGIGPAEADQVRRSQLTSDVFLSGSNAVTAEGHLVNIDGAGNRVAAMTFGPKKVIVVAGINKIVRDREEALARIKNQAAPLNFYRLNLPAPCVKSTFCADCSPPAKFCRITAVTEVRPSGIPEFVVIIVGETLGL